MPFNRPTLTQGRAQLLTDLDGALPAEEGRLRFDVPGFLATALSDALAGHYSYLDWIARQATPFTATSEFLEAWASLRGETRKAAVQASGPIVFSAYGTVPVPAGTAMTRPDGARFVTTEDAAATGGNVTLAITADAAGTGAGAAGNTDPGALFTLVNPVDGVSMTAVSGSALAGGADAESDDSLRTRMLLAYAAPSRGGNVSDFRTWALGVPGVTRAWPVRRGMGTGTVVIYFMMDVLEAAFDGFPQGTNGVSAYESRDPATATGDQLDVANALFDTVPVEPITYLCAPGRNNVTLTLSGLSGASAGVKAALEAACAAVLFDQGIPGGVVDVSALEAAIAAVPGTAGFVITGIACSHGSVSPGSSGNIQSNTGYLPMLAAPVYS